MIVRETRKIDSKMRILLPRNSGLKEGDEVYFELTKKGDLVIRKVRVNNEVEWERKRVFNWRNPSKV